MTVSLLGVGMIVVGLIAAPILARVMIVAVHIAAGWLLAHLIGYGTIYTIIVGLGFAAFIVVEAGHHMGKRH